MERTYWEKIAPDYNEEIFDVLKNDKKGVILSAIEQCANPSSTVIDIGCAIGKWLPILSPLFKKVIAVDISAKNLSIAKKTYPHLSNIEYLRADMSGKTKLPRCDFAVCINAILTDSQKKRNIFFKQLSTCLKKKGHLVLVVPSLESWLLTRIIQQRWKIDRNLFNDRFTTKEVQKKYINIQQGNADIDNVATKHYLREELELLLTQEGFLIEDCQKIEYNWTTEFVKPPKWLNKPGPWDWMVLAKKTR
jgi:SAM-dependent methyltransferase